MVIDDFDMLDSAVSPNEANSILVVDTDGMLTPALSLERLQSVTGRNSQVGENLSDVELLEFTQGDGLDVGRKFGTLFAAINRGGGFAAEREYHDSVMVTLCITNA